MKSENCEFFRQNTFIDRVQTSMARRDLDYDQLCEIMNDKVGFSITKGNLRMYIGQRVPNVNFLMALSAALGVSTDFLLGKGTSELEEGINPRIHSKRYKKYIGNYYVYFYDTVSNEQREIEPARMRIELTDRYTVTMDIDTKEGGKKEYHGELKISDSSPNVFIILHSVIGEVVSMAFYDEVINVLSFRCAVGAMLSVSSGDLKRAPVMNRFVMTDYKVAEDKMKYIYSHLMLNTKYINISGDELEERAKKVLNDAKASEIIRRLKNAFCEKRYYAIEESFIINTIRRDLKLSAEIADELVAELRLGSSADVNAKINKMLDAAVFRNTYTGEETNADK